MACDDIVLAQSHEPQSVRIISDFVRRKAAHARGLTLVQALVSRMRQMSMRVAQILDAKRPRRTGLWKPVLGVSTVLLAVVFGVAPYVPQLVAFRNQPGRSQSAQMPHQAKLDKLEMLERGSRRQSQPPICIGAAGFAANQLSRPGPERFLPLSTRGSCGPVRLKASRPSNAPQATTPAQPAVMRAKAERKSLPARRLRHSGNHAI